MIDDTVFEAQAHRLRRQLLEVLRTCLTQPIQEPSCESLELLMAHDTFLDEYLTSSITTETADKELVRLHHVHLPELAENGFIEWDRDTNIVTKGPRFDKLMPILELVEADREDRSDRVPLIVQQEMEKGSHEFYVSKSSTPSDSPPFAYRCAVSAERRVHNARNNPFTQFLKTTRISKT